MFKTMRATGAYGIPATIEGWKKGNDFYSLDHRTYFSIRDYETLRRGGIISIDFMQQNSKVFTIKIE